MLMSVLHQCVKLLTTDKQPDILQRFISVKIQIIADLSLTMTITVQSAILTGCVLSLSVDSNLRSQVTFASDDENEEFKNSK